MGYDNLGDRMKQYENCYRSQLPIRMPLILRIDGCHFHTYLKGCQKPVDDKVVNVMNSVAVFLCENIQGCQIAYTQSDEISLLLNNYKELTTQSWFANNLSKICSVAAGMAAANFSLLSHTIFDKTKIALFDCRAFVLPKEEVNNYFLWRQQDCIRNSIQSLAYSLFSHKQCDNKNTKELKELCLTKGINWDDCLIEQQRGRCAVKIKTLKDGINPKTNEVFKAERTEWVIDNKIPIFSKDNTYINQYI